MKYIVIAFLIVGSTFASIPKSDNSKSHFSSIEQNEAFKVLTQKCNVCHVKQNPSKVFTLENMNGFARKINRQVFIWKRMPKGDEISLSESEKITLKNWLDNQLKK